MQLHFTLPIQLASSNVSLFFSFFSFFKFVSIVVLSFMCLDEFPALLLIEINYVEECVLFSLLSIHRLTTLSLTSSLLVLGDGS